MNQNQVKPNSSIRRAVVKVGSNVLTAQAGLNIDAIASISSQICQLLDRGIQIILVSSGAMASGMKKMGLPQRPEAIPKRQAISAIGQAGLIREWEKAFARFGRKVAQILLTSDDLTSRKRYLNARNTLNTLLEWQVVPIINENDTIMVEEIKLGDNDNLAAVIALLDAIGSRGELDHRADNPSLQQDEADDEKGCGFDAKEDRAGRHEAGDDERDDRGLAIHSESSPIRSEIARFATLIVDPPPMSRVKVSSSSERIVP